MLNTINTIASTIQNLLAEKLPFVLYRKGDMQKVNCLVQEDAQLHFTENFTSSGFVMAAFDTSKNPILIPLDKAKKSYFDTPKISSNQKSIQANFYKENKKTHIELVTKAIAFIKEKKATKIVLSRREEHHINKTKIGLIYENLLQTYPNAMVYIWCHPKVGLWMGATPEKLVALESNQYKTMALAGTQMYAEDCQWGAKEQEEQQLVTDFVRSQLNPISKTINIGKPYTTKAGHLAHICTDVTGELTPNHSIADLLVQLHPTPAVCGTPREVAKDFIIKNEGYNREFYTGFLGELNLDDSSDLFVNLRCMQLKDNKAILYIGGGITAFSNPEKEWEETQNKANVMGQVLRIL